MDWIAFFSYVVVSSVTPGPNNLMCMANGTKFGFRRGIKFCFGVATGFVLVLLCAIACNVFIYYYIPSIIQIMTPLGAAYILWLAWVVWRDKPKEKKKSRFQLDTTSFWVGVILQFANPKGLLFGITLITNFVFPYDHSLQMCAIVLAINWVTIIFSNILWLLFGSMFQRFFEQYKKGLNLIMALLLVYCAVSLFL